MTVTLQIRLEEFPDSPHLVTATYDANGIVHWLSGLLAGGVIVDRMMVLGK